MVDASIELVRTMAPTEVSARGQPCSAQSRHIVTWHELVLEGMDLR